MRKICLWVMHVQADDMEACLLCLRHALVFSAMECEVEIYFMGSAVRLLDAELPQSAHVWLESIQEAKREGVRIFACTSAWKKFALPDHLPSAFCEGLAGSATYLARAMQADWRVLIY
ncbi:MAG: DsrE family protein [Betaproteobacteria bacterium]|jgi:hypothetical protein